MTVIRTQNGREVVKGDHIAVDHNDYWNSHKSNFGQYFVGVVNVGAAAYDAAYDPIIFMPRNDKTPGTAAHQQRDLELREMANTIAEAFRQQIAAR